MKPILALIVVLVAAPARAQQPCQLVPTSAGGYTLTCDHAPAEAHPRLYRAAVTALGALMFADAMQTAYAIGSGRGQELNPVLAPFASRPVLFGLTKGALDTAAIVALVKMHETPSQRKRALLVLGVQAGLSAAAVISGRAALNQTFHKEQ